MTARSRQTDKAAKLGLRVELPSGLTRSATRARQGRQGGHCETLSTRPGHADAVVRLVYPPRS